MQLRVAGDHHRTFPPSRHRPGHLSAPRRLLALGEAPTLDEKLVAGADHGGDPVLAHRASRLTSGRSRRTLAAGLRGVIARAERPPRLSSTVPIARTSVLRERPRLTQLADRLEAPLPVSPQGVAAIRLLLTEGTSPLYAGGEPDDLVAALRFAISGLEA